MRKPFDLDYWWSHPDCKVETGSGEKVSIVKTDMKNDYPILAIIEDAPNHEDYDSFTLEGKNSKTLEDSNNDLFIVTDEPELTEFEIRLLSWLSSDTKGEIPMEKMTSCVKARAKELLSLAREQLIHDGYIIEKKAFHDAVEKVEPEVMKDVSANLDLANFVYDLGERYPEVSFAKLTRIAKAAYDYGKAEALKDLPRWEKCEKPFDTESNCGFNGEFFIWKGRVIRISALVEKLPGFKE